MARIQRVAQYIQRLAYESLIQNEEPEERPADAQARLPERPPNYPVWNATSFSSYVPFSGPKDS
ncbi:MAG: hypothetical protein ABI769_06540 [Pseudomonadota bacterium]